MLLLLLLLRIDVEYQPSWCSPVVSLSPYENVPITCFARAPIAVPLHNNTHVLCFSKYHFIKLWRWLVCICFSCYPSSFISVQTCPSSLISPLRFKDAPLFPLPTVATVFLFPYISTVQWNLTLRSPHW